MCVCKYKFTRVSTLWAQPPKICSAQIPFACEGENQEKCSHKHFKTVNSVGGTNVVHSWADDIQWALVLGVSGTRKRKTGAAFTPSEPASHPCGTCRKIISTITWWKRKCNVRKSTVKEHLRPQQAVPKHMLLRCFQQCSIFSPCRRKASIYSRLTFVLLQDWLHLSLIFSGSAGYNMNHPNHAFIFLCQYGLHQKEKSKHVVVPVKPVNGFHLIKTGNFFFPF